MKHVTLKGVSRITFLATVAMLCSFILHARDIAGQWKGVLPVQGKQLNLVFNIEKTGTGYTATMDSPDQGAKGIPVTAVQFEHNTLVLHIANAGIEYTGTLDQDSIKGVFKQSGMSFPMNLYATATAETGHLGKKQEPVRPYPYLEEEVRFDNKAAGITLAGTLTLPRKEGRFPAVILISGSGPQNRDEELLGHKPFLVLADRLTRNGIAVLRFDDRGTAASGGMFATATSADFATDVKAAVAYLKSRKEINPSKIGLAGHSEGGMIAPMVAVGNPEIGFIVLLAGPGIPGDELLLLQQQLVGKAAGASDAELQQTKKENETAFAMIRKNQDGTSLKAALEALLHKELAQVADSSLPAGTTREQLFTRQLSALTNPWMLYFLRYDPAVALRKVTCPVLAINGEKDLQVPAAVNLAAIQKNLELAGNKHVAIKELPGLNHLFQECSTGSPSEYALMEQTMSPVALKEITDWILQTVK